MSVTENREPARLSREKIRRRSRLMSEVLEMLLDRVETPIGKMLVVADHEGNLRALYFDDYEAGLQRSLSRQYGKNGFRLTEARNPHELSAAIAQYFAGDVKVIDKLPVKTGGTKFQREVWRALREIPCGKTISYGELAKRIGRPAAVRAVGLANGSNPIGVVVPCHRVIGADGSLTGYGGGMERKRWLLKHEGASFEVKQQTTAAQTPLFPTPLR
jgi:methylated-DNA-[protein]-cysteine S-methyltransferase